MDEHSHPWPQQDADGRYLLRPSRKKLFLAWLFLLAIALAGVFSAVAPARPGHPLDPVFGGLTAIIFVPMILVFPIAVRVGRFTLTTDENGFSLGKNRCIWADVVGPFHLRADRSRRKLLVRYRTGNGMRQISNLYPMSTESLAEFMNERLKAASWRTAVRRDSISTAPISPTAMRRIQLLLWLLTVACVIGTVLVLVTIMHRG